MCIVWLVALQGSNGTISPLVNELSPEDVEGSLGNEDDLPWVPLLEMAQHKHKHPSNDSNNRYVRSVVHIYTYIYIYM